jgi:hypothetical protein
MHQVLDTPQDDGQLLEDVGVPGSVSRALRRSTG